MLLNHKLIATNTLFHEKTRKGQVTRSPHLSQPQTSPKTHLRCPCSRPTSTHSPVFLEALLLQGQHKDWKIPQLEQSVNSGMGWNEKAKAFSLPLTKLQQLRCSVSAFRQRSSSVWFTEIHSLKDPCVLTALELSISDRGIFKGKKKGFHWKTKGNKTS